jgi:hypothetical protein
MLVPMPYPLADREYIDITLWEKMENGDFFIFSINTTHPEFPPAEGVVPLDCSRAITIRQTGPRCSSVESVSHADLGGAIPSWVNTRVTVPTMKSSSISIQQYVRERKPPLLQRVN